jgi:hypothetical protein
VRILLAPRRYALTLEAPGYVSQTREVAVEEGEHPFVDFTLEKLSTLRIEADVSGATVQLDGVPAGAAPLQRELRAGLYHVQAAKEGYATVTREVRVNPGEQISLVLSLAPLPRERLLQLAVEPALGASVRIDGRPEAAPLAVRLKSGMHDLRVSSRGYDVLQQRIFVPEDRDLSLRARLVAKRSRKQRALFWTVESVASLAATLGIGFGIAALEDQASFNRVPTVAMRDQARQHAAVTDGMLGTAAAVALAGGIYYLVTWPRHSRLEDRP